MRMSTSTIALAAFMGSTAMTGAGRALVTAFAVGQAVWLAIVGTPLMLFSVGVTVGRWPLRDERLPQNEEELRVMRLAPSNGHSPYSRTWPATRRGPRQRGAPAPPPYSAG